MIQDTHVAVAEELPQPVRARLEALGWSERVGSDLGLWVSVPQQCLYGIERGRVRFAYLCSTAAKGTGNQVNSNQTPLGWHEIAEKIGDGLPWGAILSERQYTGRNWSAGEPTEKDYVLTRVLWLRGLVPGMNAGAGIDSYERYIYIHGTPAEERLGSPASHGCIRLSNNHVIELFVRVEAGTKVLITEW